MRLPIQRRIHLAIYLPNITTNQRKAFSRVIDYLKTQRQDELAVTGYTQLDNHLGTWWDDEFEWIDDRVTIISLDLIGDERNDAFGKELVSLKRFILGAYKATNAFQKDIWITTHPINQYL